MRSLLIALSLCIVVSSFGQTDTTRWLRGFPVTGYMVDLNDSVKVVQVELPDYIHINDNQLGLLNGVAKDSNEDAVRKGYGRCHLIKGNYYYFSIGHNESGRPVREGDLLYTFMDRSDICYEKIAPLAGHFIRLTDVYDQPFYDRYTVFVNWTKKNEQAVLDSMVRDIHFTGQYFANNQPSMDQKIDRGKFSGKTILGVMQECTVDDLTAFMDFILARPLLYAGRDWKVSEVFATWVKNGAPGA